MQGIDYNTASAGSLITAAEQAAKRFAAGDNSSPAVYRTDYLDELLRTLKGHIAFLVMERDRIIRERRPLPMERELAS